MTGRVRPYVFYDVSYQTLIQEVMERAARKKTESQTSKT
jgi:hypothetical protein